jgi:hypothetical protein
MSYRPAKRRRHKYFKMLAYSASVWFAYGDRDSLGDGMAWMKTERGIIPGLLAGFLCLAAATGVSAGPLMASYVLLGEDGARIARVITSAPQCPSMVLDGRQAAMNVRASAATIPQRTTISSPEDSKPSAFAVLTCEATIPASVSAASVEDRPLPLPPSVIRRIVVIGDTGCRLKVLDKAFQPCNDPKAYPFAQVAASAARWKPDLVVHVGDFLYRENACPTDQPGCTGSPWGYGADAWQADFFGPAEPLLRAAPLAMARGNHESCARAGQGWWRFLDVRELLDGRDCNDPAYDAIGDFSDPYAVPLGEDAQLIMFDSSDTSGKPLADSDIRAARYRDAYVKIAALAAGSPHNILVNHHPVLGFAAKQEDSGQVTLEPGNRGLQSVFGSLNPATLLPEGIEVSLAGHIHLWEQVSYSTGHATQFIAGFSGTLEDIVPLPAQPPADATPAKGAVVRSMSSWVDGFGFMTMERQGPDQWTVQVHDVTGAVVNTCQVKGRQADCAVAQVAKR